MRKMLLLLCLILVGCVQMHARTVELFNFGWTFQSGNVEKASQVDFDDRDWKSIDLPHDYQIEQPWIKEGNSQRGFKALTDGWYRKTFYADSSWIGKKVYLDFEGVMVWGEVWFNGKKLAEMDYGYLGCEVDLTDRLVYDKKNVIAVYSSTKGNSRWYTGGGIFRDVHLITRNPISIARHGVFIHTPVVTKEKADVAVQVEIDGFSGKHQDLEILAVIRTQDGKVVAKEKCLAPKGIRLKTIEVKMPKITVEHPMLWSCDAPNLYTAEVILRQEGETLDCLTETFGIRTIEFSPDFGLKLNGEKIFLKGVANHHDLGAIGAAVYDFSIERLFKRLKAFGYNHIRTSHNPYSSSFLKLADQYGILVVDELADKWSEKSYWPGRKPFSQLWYKMIPEWIKRDRNHPSVILWSLGNELQMREDLAGFQTGDWGVTTYKILDVMTKRYDPTRKTTVAMYPSRANALSRKNSGFNTNFSPPELSLVTEVASYNYQYEVYSKYLEHDPNLIVYQSEATTNDLLLPYYGMDHNRMVGLAYWGGIEYWGESNGWPKKGWNFSFFNHALEPNPEAYLIKSAFCETPLVHITVIEKGTELLEWNDNVVGRVPVTSHWNWEKRANLNLYTYTNADEVELFINGKSLGIQKNARDTIHKRNKILWQNVPYEPGRIWAVARSAGKQVAIHTLETSGKAVGIKLVPENETWRSGGMDLQYVRVYAVDRKGRVVHDAEGEVFFEVSGAAQLLAVDNGDHFTDRVFSEGNSTKWHRGFAMAILRSSQQPGNVKIRVSSKNLSTEILRMSTSNASN